MSQQSIPLIIEPHPENYTGYPFLTLIQYRGVEEYLGIVDNSDDKSIRAFVLDLCGPTRVNEEAVVRIASQWFETGNHQLYPVSIEFMRAEFYGVGSILRTFSTNYTTRIIGPKPSFNMARTKSIKRRRRREVSPNIPINHGSQKVKTF